MIFLGGPERSSARTSRKRRMTTSFESAAADPSSRPAPRLTTTSAIERLTSTTRSSTAQIPTSFHSIADGRSFCASWRNWTSPTDARWTSPPQGASPRLTPLRIRDQGDPKNASPHAGVRRAIPAEVATAREGPADQIGPVALLVVQSLVLMHWIHLPQAGVPTMVVSRPLPPWVPMML